METLRTSQKEMLESKNTLKEMKTVFGGLLSRLDTAKTSLKISKQKPPKLKYKEEKKMKRQKRAPKNCGATLKGLRYT